MAKPQRAELSSLSTRSAVYDAEPQPSGLTGWLWTRLIGTGGRLDEVDGRAAVEGVADLGVPRATAAFMRSAKRMRPAERMSPVHGLDRRRRTASANLHSPL